MSKPNILILITDQQTHMAMSCAGNQWLRTPAETDPGEMVNLAVSSRHDDMLADLRSRLAAWRKDTSDAFQVPGHEILSPGATRQPEYQE
ncbi:MAG: hypothetical protein ACLFVU_13815 [Phycisphaerae bacterium]